MFLNNNNLPIIPLLLLIRQKRKVPFICDRKLLFFMSNGLYKFWNMDKQYWIGSFLKLRHFYVMESFCIMERKEKFHKK